jgi:hypothetical protein
MASVQYDLYGLPSDPEDKPLNKYLSEGGKKYFE